MNFSFQELIGNVRHHCCRFDGLGELGRLSKRRRRTEDRPDKTTAGKPIWFPL